MVIQKFNKFIRNKWAWGAIAVLFCIMFVGADVIANLTSGGDSSVYGAGELGGETVDFREFNNYLNDINLTLRQSTEQIGRAELNRRAWEALASARTAKSAGVQITNEQLAEVIESMFSNNGGFDFAQYETMLARNLGMTPAQFEEHLRRQLLVSEGVNRTLLSTGVWASPMEVDQQVADMTDVFTIRVANFKADANATVEITDQKIKDWYEANNEKIRLADRVKIRFVKFDATNAEVLAKMSVSEDDLRDFYDANNDNYQVADEKGVSSVKEFDAVRADIEKELRQIEAVTYFQTNLNMRLYGPEVSFASGVSRLDAIAKEDALKVETSDWFSIDGSVVENFMTSVDNILPNAKNFLETVAELDSSSEDLRYGIVASQSAVWLIEKAETSASHIPTFEEAKGKIVNLVLRDAKADAFKASVEAVSAKGVDAILASGNVSTNITFSAAEVAANSFENQRAVIGATTKLKTGEISEFTLLSPDEAILVYCEKRVPGDAAKAVLMRSQLRDQTTFMTLRDVSSKWQKWNLERLNLKTSSSTSIEEESTEEDA